MRDLFGCEQLRPKMHQLAKAIALQPLDSEAKFFGPARASPSAGGNTCLTLNESRTDSPAPSARP